MGSFQRLIRFRAIDGQIYFAEAPKSSALVGQTVNTYSKNPLESEVSLSGNEKVIAEVLSPVPKVPIFYGIGLNYRQHANEGGLPIPKYPMVFTKPPDALAGPYEEIPITNPLAEMMDYEGELCVVISKPAKDIPETANPLEYVLGYTVGNDVSSRWWQLPDQCGGQHGYAKSFDKFAPIGPVLVSAKEIPDPSKLSLTTKVNGEQRQSTKTDDLIFDIPEIIRHLSRGTTLRPGTVIMTGTPSGVGFFCNPKQFLKDGDEVEVEISGIGAIKNRMRFV